MAISLTLFLLSSAIGVIIIKFIQNKIYLIML